MITLHNIAKSYALRGQRKHLFRGLNLHLPQGRNLAIMGHNGAGKSTLMRLMAGSEQPDHGRITRAGRVSWPIGFAGGFNGAMTAEESIRFVARLYGAAPARAQTEVEAFAQLGPALRQPLHSYSQGMRARLAFGLSLAIDFDLYLIDEITAVGDAAFRAASRAALAAKCADRQIVMISHSPAQIAEFCDCGLLLTAQGVLYFDEIPALIAAYRGAGAAGQAPVFDMP